jgi:phage gpG-like protein
MSFSAEIDAYRATVKVDQVPLKVLFALRRKRDALLLALEAKAKGYAPVGPSTKTHVGGQLRRSIFSKANDSDTLVEGVVATGADTPYARIQELGGTVQIPEIVPTKARALAFAVGGKTVFAMRAKAHSVTIPAQRYMGRAFDDMRQTIIEQMTAAARDAAGSP